MFIRIPYSILINKVISKPLLLLGIVIVMTACHSKRNLYSPISYEEDYSHRVNKQLLQDTIPFRLTSSNNIIIQAVLNQKDTIDLMFHTAEGSISIIKEVVDSLSTFNPSIIQEGIKTWGGGATTKYALNNTLKVGLTKKDSLTIYQTGLSGHESDGKFGPAFFDDKILELDFNQNHLIVYDTMPPKAINYTVHPVSIERESMMFIQGKVVIDKAEIAHRFLIHSGFAGRLLLNDEIANEYNLDKKLETISEGQLKDSYGNIIKTKIAMLPIFYLGEQLFDDLPIGFFSGSIGRQKISLMGGDLIRRFNMIIDRKDSKVYLKPNVNLNLPYTEN